MEQNGIIAWIAAFFLLLYGHSLNHKVDAKVETYNTTVKAKTHDGP